MAKATSSTFQHWADYLESARDGYSRPVANNTRVHWVGEDAVAFRLHSTDVVTLRRDGSYELRSGGWHTVTTADRIRRFSPTDWFSIDGWWYLSIEDDPHDPRPAEREREIPKPYAVADPGPEPVKGAEGCIAGQVEHYSYCERKHVFEREMRPGDWRVGWDGGSFFGVERWANGVIAHVEEALAWNTSEKYKQLHGPNTDVKQCPHCRAFDALHREWAAAYDGEYSWRVQRRRGGYAEMVEMLERYGSREAWQAAYIAEFREIRAHNAARKAWFERNYVAFYEGIVVTPQGRVPLKAKRDHLRMLRQQARVDASDERRRKRIERDRAKLAARQAERRMVMRAVAEALAESAITELEVLRGESFIKAAA